MTNLNKKKTGILTFHASHNCGSMMQAYAMQAVLNRLGYENEIINYRNEGQKDMYAVIHRKVNLKNVIRNTIGIFHYGKLKKQWLDYETFLHNTFILSEREYSNTSEIQLIRNHYRACVCGADQIWNITIKDSDDAYFLPFEKGKMKKIAYAPSFGAKRIQDYSSDVQKYAGYLKDYDSLSVRENNGQKWIFELIGKKVPVVLDPTLLIDREYYERIREDSGIEGDYIFYYSPSYSYRLDQFVKKISNKYKLPVIVWNANEYYLKFEFINGFKLPNKFNPGIYFDLISNAKLVVTTSFHGTIFSTICKKNFWILKNGGMYGDDDRVKTLIEQLGIENRLIEPVFDNKFNYLIDCNYSEYNRKIGYLRKKSIKYLMDSLKGGLKDGKK